MFRIDFTLVITMFLFGITYFGLKRILFTPMLRFLEERDERLTHLNRETEALKSEYENLVDQYHQKIRQGRKEGVAKVNQAVLEAGNLRKQRMTEKQEVIQKNLNRIEVEVRSQVEAARADLDPQVDSYAKKIAEKILSRPLKG